MIAALLSVGVSINIYERKGFLFNRDFPLHYNIKRRITNQFKGNVVFTFEHPRTYQYLPRKSFNVGFLVFEFTRLPELWVENINNYLDLVVVPSYFCKKNFLESGVDQCKIRVLRYGFNPAYYYPAVKKRDSRTAWTFLCVANPHKREGIELLLKSFTRAFTPKDKVKLILKLTYLPSQRVKSFEYSDLSGLFRPFLDYWDDSQIEIITDTFTEKQMGDFYRASDCYVSLSRAEAFGLCFLEALACGLPVVGINWGGQADFLNRRNSCFIKHTLVPTTGEEYEQADPAGLIALPDIEHAAKVMRRIFLKGRGVLVSQQVLQPSPQYFWWLTIARDFLGYLRGF
jgi:glycosyltransferase involved in cell wall biosynthesis